MKKIIKELNEYAGFLDLLILIVFILNFALDIITYMRAL